MLIRKNEAAEVFTAERCHIRELLNDERVPQTSLAECRVEPGVTTQLHRLSVAEWYLIREGEGLMQIGRDQPFAVGPGDVVVIAPNAPQRITSTGSTDLLFLCLCLPAFTPGCYESLETTEESPS